MGFFEGKLLPAPQTSLYPKSPLQLAVSLDKCPLLSHCQLLFLTRGSFPKRPASQQPVGSELTPSTTTSRDVTGQVGEATSSASLVGRARGKPRPPPLSAPLPRPLNVLSPQHKTAASLGRKGAELPDQRRLLTLPHHESAPPPGPSQRRPHLHTGTCPLCASCASCPCPPLPRAAPHGSAAPGLAVCPSFWLPPLGLVPGEPADRGEGEERGRKQSDETAGKGKGRESGVAARRARATAAPSGSPAVLQPPPQFFLFMAKIT